MLLTIFELKLSLFLSCERVAVTTPDRVCNVQATDRGCRYGRDGA